MSELRLRLGEADGRAFQAFLQEELARGKGPPGVAVSVAFQPSAPPAGGFGMTVPPEVIIEVVKVVGTAVATGVAAEFGKQVGQWLWTKLREFFATRNASGTLPDAIEVRTGSNLEPIDLRAGGDEPPDILTHISPATSSG